MRFFGSTLYAKITYSRLPKIDTFSVPPKIRKCVNVWEKQFLVQKSLFLRVRSSADPHAYGCLAIHAYSWCFCLILWAIEKFSKPIMLEFKYDDRDYLFHEKNYFKNFFRFFFSWPIFFFSLPHFLHIVVVSSHGTFLFNQNKVLFNFFKISRNLVKCVNLWSVNLWETTV